MLDKQTEREIALYEAMLRDITTTYQGRFGTAVVDRSEGTVSIGVEDGSVLYVAEVNPELPIWLNIEIAEREFEDLMSDDFAEEYTEDYIED